MNAVFADTFFWIAFTDTQDSAHERAKSLIAAAPPRAICTTEEVLTEYLNYFAAWGAQLRRKAAINVEKMLENPAVEIVPQTAKSFLAGLELYRTRLDKGYSLTDCISMQTMRLRGIADVLTNDRISSRKAFEPCFAKLESWKIATFRGFFGRPPI